MSNGQWEVVGKNKKSQNGKIKANNDATKHMKNGAKPEDNFQQHQNKGNLNDGDKKEKKKKETEKKNKPEKKNGSPKPKPPKTIGAAIESLDATELANLIAANKIRYINAPLVWLREVATYLNSKTAIEIEDHTFANQEIDYPSSALDNEVKDLLKGLLKDTGKANNQLFFDSTLTAIANDMSRGQTVNGHRLLIQILAQENPEFCTSSMQKSVSLRNSYQNRPPIGLTLLWAFGQGGWKDFGVGLQAWQDLFYPIIELKSYTKYVIFYLTNMVDFHSSRDAKISQEKFLALVDLLNTKRNLSKDNSSELVEQFVKIKDIYFKNSNKHQVTFNQLMKRLPNQYLTSDNVDLYTKVILQSLLDCMRLDDSVNSTWRQLFVRCSKQSATFLDFIDSNWDTVSQSVKLKSLKLTVKQYQEVCSEVIKGKKRDDTIERTSKVCQDILDRMASSRRFPWFRYSFYLLVLIAGVITYDVSRVGGNFPKSATGGFLKNLGMLELTQSAWQKTLSSSARGYIWLETNTPIYYKQASEFSKPYLELTKDMSIVAFNKAGVLYANVKDYVVAKTPVVVSTIDEYVPGLVDNVQKYASSGWTAVKDFSCTYYNLSSDYLKNNVFVGEWAPEVLQNKTQLALNVTSHRVSEYYHWLRKQVNVYSKIP